MAKCALAIGGTGARCLEALVHLCAIGMGPEELFVLVLDPDESNGNIGILRDVITKYQDCRERLGSGATIFKTKIEYCTEKLSWSPAKPRERLIDCFDYPTLKARPQEKILADICDLLYTNSELKLEMDKGFWGHATIGAPIMARLKKEFKEANEAHSHANNSVGNPWRMMRNKIEEDLHGGVGGAHLFLFGSIFGATGASGLPAAGKILRDVLGKEVHIGGAFLLPYFGFAKQESRNVSDVISLSEDFFHKTKIALQYYSDIWGLESQGSPFDNVYLIGETELGMRQGDEQRPYAGGGPEQNNYAHYIELMAALAAIDSFHTERNFNAEQGSKIIRECTIARNANSVIEWSDLPESGLRERLVIFTTLAFAFRNFYHPLIMKEYINRSLRLFPWYVDHFDRKEIFDPNKMNAVNGYFKDFLEWLYRIHHSAQVDLRLLNRNILRKSRESTENGEPYKSLADYEFKDLLSDTKGACSHGYDILWQELCGLEKIKIEPYSCEGKLLYLLYLASQRFCNQNYQFVQNTTGGQT